MPRNERQPRSELRRRPIIVRDKDVFDAAKVRVQSHKSIACHEHFGEFSAVLDLTPVASAFERKQRLGAQSPELVVDRIFFRGPGQHVGHDGVLGQVVGALFRRQRQVDLRSSAGISDRKIDLDALFRLTATSQVDLEAKTGVFAVHVSSRARVQREPIGIDRTDDCPPDRFANVGLRAPVRDYGHLQAQCGRNQEGVRRRIIGDLTG